MDVYNNNQDPFATWVASSSPDIVVPAFQLLGKHHPNACILSDFDSMTALDSFQVHRKLHHNHPYWQAFDLPADIRPETVSSVWQWFTNIDAIMIDTELLALDVLFP